MFKGEERQTLITLLEKEKERWIDKRDSKIPSHLTIGQNKGQ